MTGGEVRRRVSREDIQLVQDLIERCLQLYMNPKEVVETLSIQAKIEPGFTELVWQKLEEENREFFKAYHLRLLLKNQIITFNNLLEKQAELMHKMRPAGVTSLPASNGSKLNHTPSSYTAERTSSISRADSVYYPHNGMMEVSHNIIPAQTSQMEMIHGMNGIVIKLESDYSNGSAFTFGADGNVRPTIGDTSGATYSSVESNSEPLNEQPLVDNDISSFGFLGQIPRNFSLSDLTADFSQSTDILESYSRSPFLAPDSDNLLDHQGRECQGENRRLDTISEGMSYEEFGND